MRKLKLQMQISLDGFVSAHNGETNFNVAELKKQPGQAILIYGAGPVAHTLMQHGLVDELRVWLYPLLAGGHGTHPQRRQRSARYEAYGHKGLRFRYRNPDIPANESG